MAHIYQREAMEHLLTWKENLPDIGMMLKNMRPTIP